MDFRDFSQGFTDVAICFDQQNKGARYTDDSAAAIKEHQAHIENDLRVVRAFWECKPWSGHLNHLGKMMINDVDFLLAPFFQILFSLPSRQSNGAHWAIRSGKVWPEPRQKKMRRSLSLSCSAEPALVNKSHLLKTQKSEGLLKIRPVDDSNQFARLE